MNTAYLDAIASADGEELEEIHIKNTKDELATRPVLIGEVSLDDKEAEKIGKLMAKATRLAISGQIDALPAVHAAIGLAYMAAIERWVEELVEDKVDHTHLTELEAVDRLLEVYA